MIEFAVYILEFAVYMIESAIYDRILVNMIEY